VTGAAPVVLDASALLAWLHDEPGAEIVDPVLPGSVLSTVNLAEVWQKLDQHGIDADRALRRVRLLGVRTEPFSDDDAVRAARLWSRGRRTGLSLGDRCCLALADRLGAPVLTADRAWRGVGASVEVRIIR
jgi:ribonuclease VapC